ncbi:hypothetical protein AJ80_06470 [Polytolypa hystricis UAMH7299]|uniref:glucan 1,3-beta-glucosidase n=1 Tax=Polytolypa hystricis (strain UAMH7299) TaxID=1447883 RepID=A0A2B7XX03_POLH7|nr:hypothetical protein AJ80_06470 [Polytolypa hystricis UAMH7299]
MPHHSRSRDRERERYAHNNRDRDSSYYRNDSQRRYRYERASGAEDRDYERYDRDDGHDDVDDVFDDGYDGDGRRRRYVEPTGRERRRGRERRYDYDDDDDNDGGGLEDEEESEVIVVDSRPNFARPPNVRPSPRRSVPPAAAAAAIDPRRRDGERYKAKESPATSPVKRKDRERDREGRRRRDSTGDEGSPTKAGRVRDRRVTRDRHRERDRDRDTGGETTDYERQRERERRRAAKEQRNTKAKHASTDSANSATQLLSADALAKLNSRHAKEVATERVRAAKEEKARLERERKRKKKQQAPRVAEKVRNRDSSGDRGQRKSAKRRLVSGALLEEGRSPELRVRGGGGGGGGARGRRDEKWRKGGGDDDGGSGGGGGGFRSWSKKKKLWILIGILAGLLVIIIPVAVVVSKNSNKGDDAEGDVKDESGSDSSAPLKKELEGVDRSSIPADAKGSYLDPFSWYDTTDFNVTYTDEQVGGLPIIGLNSKWDDSARPNDKVPPLNKPFPYGKQPIRGVNLGGWLSIEPFITPSFFKDYSRKDNIIDEYTLTSRLGERATSLLEEHYATFINEQSFKEIRDAGLDHVRIPYSYWIVKTYDGDPYVAKIGFRYLLRAIEYCRKYGIRVKLDMHGLPGSQNGWNHSGRSGSIGWLHGNDGDLHAQRSLDIHSQLSTFFSQPRYNNVITIYGLANEPMMLTLDIEKVLNWNTKAVELIRKNGIKQHIAFADGFLKLSKWSTMQKDLDDKLLIDTHQYTIFNTGQVGLDHKEKLDLVCKGWVDLIGQSNSRDTGWGPTICGEWSQADTDCAQFLNNVGVGSRWTGTMDHPSAKSQVLTPLCPTHDDRGKPACSCDQANAPASEYSDSYKRFLQTYAEAQMFAFERGWGWFYWTWQTENAVQWSYKKGMEAGTLPKIAYEPSFTCGDEYPDFGDLPEHY